VKREREKSEFDRAINTVSESLEMSQSPEALSEDPDLAAFYQQRLRTLADFFTSLDNLVAMILALDSLRSSALDALLRKNRDEAQN